MESLAHGRLSILWLTETEFLNKNPDTRVCWAASSGMKRAPTSVPKSGAAAMASRYGFMALEADASNTGDVTIRLYPSNFLQFRVLLLLILPGCDHRIASLDRDCLGNGV